LRVEVSNKKKSLSENSQKGKKKRKRGRRLALAGQEDMKTQSRM